MCLSLKHSLCLTEMAKGETEHHSWRMGFCTTVLLPLLGALLLLSPPKLDLDPITSLVASVVTLSDRVSEALGVPTIGSFNPVDNPAGVAQVREVRFPLPCMRCNFPALHAVVCVRTDLE